MQAEIIIFPNSPYVKYLQFLPTLVNFFSIMKIRWKVSSPNQKREGPQSFPENKREKTEKGNWDFLFYFMPSRIMKSEFWPLSIHFSPFGNLNWRILFISSSLHFFPHVIPVILFYLKNVASHCWVILRHYFLNQIVLSYQYLSI